MSLLIHAYSICKNQNPTELNTVVYSAGTVEHAKLCDSI